MANNGSDVQDVQAQYQAPTPSPALRQLDKLVGTWSLKGCDFGADEGSDEIRGQVRFEWMEGGFYLVQHVDIVHAGNRNRGIEIIGCERGWGAEQAGEDCTSHYFGSAGEHFSYVYDVDGETITIWGGERGSPAAFRGSFSADRKTITGAWKWPGGGYSATMTKVEGA